MRKSTKSEVVAIIESSFYYRPLAYKKAIPNYSRIRNLHSWFCRQSRKKLVDLFCQVTGLNSTIIEYYD